MTSSDSLPTSVSSDDDGVSSVAGSVAGGSSAGGVSSVGGAESAVGVSSVGGGGDSFVAAGGVSSVGVDGASDEAGSADAGSADARSAEAGESLDQAGSLDEDSSVDEAGSLDEGDIAADYIEELLDILDLDGDIDIETRGGRSYISVDSAGEGDLRLLSKPDTVNALQELTRIAVQTRTGEFSRLILDVGGSRATREQELTTLVDRAIAKLEEGATAASLPPMSSYERKLVHDIVASRGDFTSESEGEGRDRHTVVSRA